MVAGHGRDELARAAPRAGGGRALRRPGREPPSRRGRDRRAARRRRRRRAAGADRHARRAAISAPAPRPRSRSSILARIVEVRRRETRAAAAVAVTAVDPICGMTVVVVRRHAVASSTTGETVYFCCEGCQAAFELPACRRLTVRLRASCSARAARKRLGRPEAAAALRRGDAARTRGGHRPRVLASTRRSSRSRRRRGGRARGRRPRRRARSWSTTPTARAARPRSPRRSTSSTSAAGVLVLMLGDQPGVTAETVAALLAGRGDAELAVCRYDDGLAATRSPSPALVFGDPRRRCTATRACGGCWTWGGDAVAEVGVPGHGPARRRHARGLRGRAPA